MTERRRQPSQTPDPEREYPFDEGKSPEKMAWSLRALEDMYARVGLRPRWLRRQRPAPPEDTPHG